MDNKTLVLNYYADMKDVALYDPLRKASMKTNNPLMHFSDSSCQYYPDTSRIIGAYIIFIKVGQLTMAHMFQDQLLNKVQKLNTMQYTLQ